MRAALPNTEWGGTFYATGYWDCNAGFVQNMPITKLDIRLDPSNSKNLQLKGKASNQSFKANNFMLRLARPRIDTFAINVSYGLVATTAVCVDQTRQANHEGFRLARIASHYISSADQDNDQARYTNTLQKIVCANLQNQSGFILNNPTALGQSPLMLVHTTTHPRNTPTLALEFSAPPLGEITPQGYVMQTSDPNSDNVDLWGNWASARANYMKGEVIGSFSYMLRVTPPSILTCP